MIYLEKRNPPEIIIFDHSFYNYYIFRQIFNLINVELDKLPLISLSPPRITMYIYINI